ncbi:MAG: sulfite exporter TauE/SafE family protein, partial [Eggerthellaceae bacterium]
MLTFIVAACVGVVVGILSGLLGIGGGTVMVPVFRLGFGLSAIEAAATSLFTIIPTSLAGCVTHIRNKTCRVPLGVAAGLGGACTSPVGVWLASISPSWAIMAAAALIIGYSAISMLKKARALPKPEKKTAAKKGAACVGASASSVLVVPPAASASAPAST